MNNLGKIIAEALRNTQLKTIANQNTAQPSVQDAPAATIPRDEPAIAPNTSIRPRIAPEPRTFETLESVNIPPDKINVPERRTVDDAMANLPSSGEPQILDNPQVETPMESPIAQNNSLRPRIAGDRRQWEINEKRRMINDPALEKIPENKPSRAKAAIGLALKEIGDTIRAGGSLGQAIGAGGAAAGAGAISPKLFADAQNQFGIEQLQREQDQDFKQKERELGLEAKQAQIDYTKERPNIEREKLRNKIELEKERQNNKIANLKMQNANKEDDWDSFVRDGKVWKIYKKRDGSDGRAVIEPLIDPETGLQMEPAEDQLFDYYDQYSGLTVKAKGPEILGAAIANAGRETSVNLANASAQNRYQNDLFDWQNKIDSFSSDYSLKNEELNGLNKKDGELKTQEDAITQEIAAMQGDLFKADQVKQKQSELEKIRQERTNLIAQSQTKKGELQKSLDQMQDLRRNRPKPPTSAQAVTTGGKTMTRGELEKIAQMKNMTPQAAEQWVRKEGYQIQ